MENIKEKNYKNAIIAFCSMLAMMCLICLYYYSKLDTAEKQIQELEKKLEVETNQPSVDYDKESSHCAGC